MAKPQTTPENLPVIIGSSGGINPAGRSGNFRGYGFMIRDQLDSPQRMEILVHQAKLLNLIRWSEKGWVDSDERVLSASDIAAKYGPLLNDYCFIRKPNPERYFDPYASRVHRRGFLEEAEIMLHRRNVPSPLPESWKVVGEDPDRRMVRIHISQETEFFLPQTNRLDVSSAGMIPDGIRLNCDAFGTKADKIPHAIKLALFGANDALKNLGIPLEDIFQVIPQNQVGLYIGSAMSQLDAQGLAGYIQAPFTDQRVTSTSVPFSLNNMALDFIAAYCMGSLGHVSCEVGACATFLYNLYNAARDIRQGKIRFALVGSADAPIQPWVFNAYNSMKALGRDESLRNANRTQKIKGPGGEEIEEIQRSAASIPFGENFGFTLAEGSQFITLFHPDLAKELGVIPQGAVGEVFCHSDGWKQSISKPGIGNYITLGRALGSLQRDLGEESLRHRSYLSAHGSSTPQNRQTESSMMDRFAKIYGIKNWPVTAVKSWLGHTLGAASGDQINAALGAFHYQIISSIRNLDRIPQDVSQERLAFCQKPFHISKDSRDGKMDCCIVNSKGFGGHNATGLIYSPELAKEWLMHFMDAKETSHYEKKQEKVLEQQNSWEKSFLEGADMIHYSTNNAYQTEDIESLTPEGLKIRGLNPLIPF